jgi:hypothetical protein
MPLDVIGTGVGRTGTRRSRTLLATPASGLLPHDGSDGGSVADPALGDPRRARPTDWEALFEGYRSVSTSRLSTGDLRQALPKAKVSPSRPRVLVGGARATIYQSSTRPNPDMAPGAAPTSRYIDAAIGPHVPWPVPQKVCDRPREGHESRSAQVPPERLPCTRSIRVGTRSAPSSAWTYRACRSRLNAAKSSWRERRGD